jgi:hypothetical protein
MQDLNYIAKHITKGNMKLPSTTYIFNCGSATHCPSRKLGLCQCPTKCYAMQAERMYKQCLPFRERQTAIIANNSPDQFVTALVMLSMRSKTNKCKCFRYNESGDFFNQHTVNWFGNVCKLLTTQYNINCYGYTARTDLDLTVLLQHSSLQVSNDLNNWQDKGANRFLAVPEYTGNNLQCAGDCRKCQMCQMVRGKTIEIEYH